MTEALAITATVYAFGLALLIVHLAFYEIPQAIRKRRQRQRDRHLLALFAALEPFERTDADNWAALARYEKELNR